jgi:hypothetical protein
MHPGHAQPNAPRPPSADGVEVVDVPYELSRDWDEAFAWSYGQRFRNVGCG